MLTQEEKRKVKDVLADGLNIRRDINLPYFLDAINNSYKTISAMQTALNEVIQNQNMLNNKLNMIINMLEMHLNK